jgi:hypothetical protein
MVGTNPRRFPARRAARDATRMSSIVVQIFKAGFASTPDRMPHIWRDLCARRGDFAYTEGTHFTAMCAPSSIPPTMPLLRRIATASCSELRVPFSAAATTRP